MCLFRQRIGESENIYGPFKKKKWGKLNSKLKLTETLRKYREREQNWKIRGASGRNEHRYVVSSETCGIGHNTTWSFARDNLLAVPKPPPDADGFLSITEIAVVLLFEERKFLPTDPKRGLYDRSIGATNERAFREHIGTYNSPVKPSLRASIGN